jgi:hypothetical protein
MIPLPPINQRYQSCFCWLAARHSRARSILLNSRTSALANIEQSSQRVHSRHLARADCAKKSSLHASIPQSLTLAGVPKSP